MKISRIFGLALVAMMLFGTTAAINKRASAQSGTVPQAQAQSCDVEDDDSAETPDADAPDTDVVQCGQQDGPGDEATDADGVDEQSPLYTGSITVDEAKYEAMTEAEETVALASFARVSEEEAKAAVLSANPGATIVKVELDNENGTVVYSVELNNGSDVKVDVGDATTLHTEAAGESDG